MRPLLPDEAPENPDKWQDVMADIEKIIMPGVTHWHSPRFHAYFPTANSYPAIVADMLSGAIACIGFTWVSDFQSVMGKVRCRQTEDAYLTELLMTSSFVIMICFN
jgi:hypothetical protein